MDNKEFVDAWFETVHFMIWAVAEKKMAMPVPRVIEENLELEEYSSYEDYDIQYFGYNGSLWAAWEKKEDEKISG